jgi:putative membrane protein
MGVIQNILVILVAFLHLLFCYLEMFLWKTTKGQKIFRIDADFAEKSAVLAANQGLYNAFLASGLIWSVCARNNEESVHLKFFFLGCVIVAGLYGAYSANKRILFMQALPAMIALGAVILTL